MKEYMERRKPENMLRSQEHINEKESKRLHYSRRRRNVANAIKPTRKNTYVNYHNNLNDLHELVFHT